MSTVDCQDMNFHDLEKSFSPPMWYNQQQNIHRTCMHTPSPTRPHIKQNRSEKERKAREREREEQGFLSGVVLLTHPRLNFPAGVFCKTHSTAPYENVI